MGLIQNQIGKFIARSINKLPDSLIFIEANKRSGGRGVEIIQSNNSLRAKTLNDWTNALQQARNVDNPNRIALYNMYDSLLLDAHTAAAIDSRIMAVLRSKWSIYNSATGEENADLKRLFETMWFERFVKATVKTIFTGATVIETFDLNEDRELAAIREIPHRHVHFWNRQIVREQYDTTGARYDEGAYANYYMQIGETDELGLLAELAPIVIAKKYAIGAWTEYVEKFGIPPRWVTTAEGNTRRQAELFNMLKNMINAGYTVLQGDEKIETLQVPNVDAYQTFDELIKRMNSEISKRILGQDGTSDNKDASGTYGSLKVLEDVAEGRHETDRVMVKQIINTVLIPKLINLSPAYTKLNNHTFDWDDFQELEINKYVDAVVKLSSIYELDEKQIEERTGIKILGKKEAMNSNTGIDNA